MHFLQMIERGDWQVSDIARNAFDLENKVVGTIGAGRIGYRVLQRLLPFDCKELLYFDYTELPAEASKAVRARRVLDLKDFVSQVCEKKSTLFSVALKHVARSVMLSLSMHRCMKAQKDFSMMIC